MIGNIYELMSDFKNNKVLTLKRNYIFMKA